MMKHAQVTVRSREVTGEARRSREERILVMASRRSRTRRTLAATTAAIAASGLVAASAATLGSLNTDDLGATQSVVAACQTSGLGIEWLPAPSYGGPGSNNYMVTGLDITGVLAACNGQNFKVTVATSGNVSLAEDTGTVTTGTTSATFSAVAAEDIEKVSVTFYE